MDGNNFPPDRSGSHQLIRDNVDPRDSIVSLTQLSIPNKKTSSSSRASSPMSSAPQTPRPSNSRRHSQAPVSPSNRSSPQLPALRRTSSAMSLASNGAPTSPALGRKGSRSSLGGRVEQNDHRLTPKRSITNLISGLREAQATMESIEEPAPLTASQIATQHFSHELSRHVESAGSAPVAVILHDDCYGHRWSRLKTTKTTLSMIVERPERLQASVLGLSAAYIRLGGHHAGASNAPYPEKPSQSSPPFTIRRSSRSLDITSSYVTNVHGTAWMSELRNMCGLAEERLASGVKEIGRTSKSPETKPLHEGDLYLAPESLAAFQGALGGVADAVDTVFNPSSPAKRAFVAVRPPGHHCSADHPSGFCWLNNVHVGIEYAAQNYGLTHAVILDFDLHHGDGSQSITWERNSRNNAKRLAAKPNSKLKLHPDVGYYSLHDINSYPCEMGDDEKVQAASLCIDNAHNQSIWNVHLEPWKNETEFWNLYETKYQIIFEKARKFLHLHNARIRAEGKVAPKAAIFVSAGFDASEWEGTGMQRHAVNVPTEFYARFTTETVRLAEEATSACDGRVLSVLEGGYSDRALCSGVASHLSGLCAVPLEHVSREVSVELDQMMRGLSIDNQNAATLHYDRAWWSESNLTALEMKVHPPPPAAVKKVRTGNQPTYATPTESFAYKVVDTNKFARTISGTIREVAKPSRPPTPPPPEVDWVIATQELSKLLIPTERLTRSHTAEELGGVRVKKEKEPTVAAPVDAQATKGRQLRDRSKAKPTGTDTFGMGARAETRESSRSVSRTSNNRRQTVHELPSAMKPRSDRPESSSQRRTSRRLSSVGVASAVPDETDAPPVPAIPSNSNISTSMRPPSSTAALQIKKTRIPSTQGGPSAPSASAPVSPSATRRVSSSVPKPGPGPDVNQLTSGMKKITLKVGTREEHDRKMKEREAAERRARALKGAETRKLNAAKKARESAAASLPALSNQSLDGTADDAMAPASTAWTPSEGSFDDAMLPDYSNSDNNNRHVNADGDVFDVPHDHPVVAVAPLTSLPSPTAPTYAAPAMSSPPAKSSPGRMLPTWSSTGPIPFADSAPRSSPPPPPITQDQIDPALQ